MWLEECRRDGVSLFPHVFQITTVDGRSIRALGGCSILLALHYRQLFRMS